MMIRSIQSFFTRVMKTGVSLFSRVATGALAASLLSITLPVAIGITINSAAHAQTGPTITSQPTSQTVTAGSTATFSVTATGTPTLTYAWQYLSGSTWKAFAAGSGYNTATLTTVPTTAAFNGLQFRVVVTDGNSMSTASNTVTLTVNSPPAITSQPVSQTVALGSKATFSVTATGTPTLTYVWQYLSGSTWKTYTAGTGLTTPTMTTAAASAAYNGLQFRVVVTDGNSLSTNSDAVTLTVNSPPVITSQPASQTVAVGNAATFSVTATGTPTLTYAWQYLSGSTWKAFGAGTGYNTATLTTVNTTAAFNGLQFRVVVTDGNSLSTTSKAVTLTVNTLPVITSQPVSETVTAGTPATFSVTATGTPTLTYTWQYLSGSTWKAFGAGTGYNTATLTTVATVAAFNGLQFRVVVTDGNSLTTTSNTVTLTVNSPPVIAAQPASQTVNVGGMATFSVTATGTPTLTYAWQYLSGTTWKAFGAGTGYNTATLTTIATTAAFNGLQFRVVVTDGNGLSTTSNAVTLTVDQLLALPSSNPASLPAAIVDQAYAGTITATGGGGSGYVFTVTGLPSDSLQNALNNGSSTLTIGGTPTTVTPAGTPISFQVSVKDGLGNSTGPVTYTIAVVAPSPLLLQAGGALPAATTNVAYSATIAASGGSGSGYVFAINGVSIPATGAKVLVSDSISVSSTGTGTLSISGTPTLTQTVTLTSVTVKDGAGDAAGPATYTIQVSPPTPLTLQGGEALAPATTNVAYSGGIIASGGSGSGYVFSVNGTAIPNTGAAVQISDSISVSSTGTSILSVSGTPTLAQTVTLTNVTVKDSAGDAAGPDTYTIAVNPPSPLTLQAGGTLSAGTTNVAYSGGITASGGSGSGYVFSLNGTAIPTTGAKVLVSDSISVSSTGTSTLSISGTPTLAQQVTLTSVTVKDSAGDTAGPDTYTIQVSAPAALTLQAGGSLAAATTNVAYSGGIVASGGSGAGYVFKVNGTAIPTTGALVLISDSISVSSTGTGTLTITGTPTLTAEVTLTSVTVKDSAGDSAGPDTYSIAVNPPSPLTLEASTSLPGATTGVAYGAGISASGGSGSGYVFTVNGVSIPITGAAVAISDGISVSNTGGSTLSIAGTPTTAEKVSLTNVTVKDSAGDSAGPDTYTIAVAAPTYSVSGQILPTSGCGSISTLPTFTVSINTSPVQTTTTDSNGNYTFASVPNGTYTITPSITGPSSLFSPAKQTNVVVNGNSVGGENFNVSLGYTVSGTVSYSGSATGPVYVELYNTGCGGGPSNGTTLSAPGPFSIRGVSPGTYRLNTWRDPLGFAQLNASDPGGSVANVSVSNAAVTGVSAALADPSAVTLSTAPRLGTVDGFSNGAIINYTPILNGGGVELPSSYTVQWSTTTSFTSPAGSQSFPASGDNTDVWFLNKANVTGLTSGDSYYFRMQGVAGGSTSAWSSTAGPITLAAPTAANTVTGTVTFTGAATGPLYVGFYDNSTGQAWAAQVGSKTAPPTSPAAYSVEVPSGTYGLFAVVDQNNDGLIDPGDFNNTNSGNGPPSVTISGSTTENVTLSSANSTVSVTTYNSQYTYDGVSSNSYGLNLDVREGVKLPIDVTLASGPNVIDPVDMGECGVNCGTPQFSYGKTLGSQPSVGDSYSFNVMYSDGTTQTLTGAVSAVLGPSALPTLVSPTGTGVSFTPEFDWTYPAGASAYTYQFWVCCGSNGNVWTIPSNNSNSNGFTSSQITPPLLWGVDPTNSGNTPSPSSLGGGTTYSWSLQVQDSNGNEGQSSTSFETQPGPVSLPAASANPLPSGIAGVPYSGGLNASGGAGGGNYYFTVNGTTIPTNFTYVTATNSDGLTFANGGGNTLYVGGTPSSAESVSLTVEVFDSTNSSDTASVTYTVVIGAPTPVSLPAASSNPLGSPVLGYPFGGTVNASGGVGGGNYYFTVNGTTIPTNMSYVTATNSDGLTFANSSGTTLWVAGSPTTAETVSLTVKVFDTTNASDTATVTYSVIVVSPPNGANNGLAKGTYVCKTNGYYDSDGSAWTTLASVVLDGKGTITSGIFDSNGTDYPNAESGTLTGTYSIGTDNNGLLTTTTVTTSGGTGSSTQEWVLALTNAGEPASPAQEFRLVEADDVGATPSGQTSNVNCYLATTSAFAVSTISAKGIAFGLQGQNGSGDLKESAGRFTASTATGSGSTATGTITSAYLDGMSLNQSGDNGGAGTGSYTGPNSSGRFTFTINPTGGGGSAVFAAYIIDAKRMFALETSGDSGVSSGEMRTQQQATYSNASLSGAAVLYGQGLEYSNSIVSGADSLIYQLSGNGAGTLTVNQSYDDNDGAYNVAKENAGTLTVSFDSTNPGRATFSPGGDSAFLFFYDTNSAFYLDLNGGGSPSFLESGWLQPQTQTTFTDAALAGTYLLSNQKLGQGDSSVGELDLASNGTSTASVSTGGENSFSFDSPQSGLSYTWLNSTYGSFSLLETGQSGGETCMVITSNNDICMDGTSSSAKMSIMQQ